MFKASTNIKVLQTNDNVHILSIHYILAKMLSWCYFIKQHYQVKSIYLKGNQTSVVDIDCIYDCLSSFEHSSRFWRNLHFMRFAAQGRSQTSLVHPLLPLGMDCILCFSKQINHYETLFRRGYVGKVKSMKSIFGNICVGGS